MDDIDADAISGAVYSYDEIGNLVGDQKEYITNIEWTPYGKVARVIKDKSYKTDCNSNEIVLQDLEFRYDGMGNRICKIVKPHKSNAQGLGLSNEDQWTYTYYVRDAQGNVMATYKRSYTNPSGSNYEEEFRLIEQGIYGSSRLGLIRTNTILSMASFSSTGFETDVTLPGLGQFLDKINYDNNPIGVDPTNQLYARTMGEKMYEGANHLGNVLVTFSDRKLPVQGTPSTVVDHYLPDVLSASDYYPFGQEMPGRTFSSNRYRYGYNGMEKDDEMKGSGNSYTTEFRLLDPRIGRWFSQDPIVKPWESPYAGFANNPIYFADPSGLDPNGGPPKDDGSANGGDVSPDGEYTYHCDENNADKDGWKYNGPLPDRAGDWSWTTEQAFMAAGGVQGGNEGMGNLYYFYDPYVVDYNTGKRGMYYWVRVKNKGEMNEYMRAGSNITVPILELNLPKPSPVDLILNIKEVKIPSPVHPGGPPPPPPPGPPPTNPPPGDGDDDNDCPPTAVRLSFTWVSFRAVPQDPVQAINELAQVAAAYRSCDNYSRVNIVIQTPWDGNPKTSNDIWGVLPRTNIGKTPEMVMIERVLFIRDGLIRLGVPKSAFGRNYYRIDWSIPGVQNGQVEIE